LLCKAKEIKLLSGAEMMFKNSACRSFETQTTNKTAALQVGKDKRQKIIKAQQFPVGGFNPFENISISQNGNLPQFSG